MSSQKTTKKSKKGSFSFQVKSVLQDILFAYKNFLHWNISKIIISLWCFALGLILSFPVFMIAMIIGIFDPIKWGEIAMYLLSGTDVSYQILGSVAMHPYNLVFMIFLIIVAICLFLLGSSYALFLKSEVSHGYTKGKKLDYKKNFYFNTSYIKTYIGIICWSFMYMLAPIVIWVGMVFFMYLFFNIGFISFDALSIWIGFYTIILVLAELYLIYRLVFSYIILSDGSKKSNPKSSLSYVKKSIEITKGKSFLRFIALYMLYILFIAPVTLFDDYLENKTGIMRDTLIYNSGLLQNLEPEQINYYEYISREYNQLSSEELSSKIQSIAALRFVLYFFSYLVFSGIFVLLLTSFYKRVLKEK